ncbi:hypothetical protein ACTMTI_40170 [Nonomuraea sp. H19]|uniref:hypothetical protein n=1 Tax=Nonomuraea sp. H19 TaxID=3452206 RepID=UPI003F8B0F4E
MLADPSAMACNALAARMLRRPYRTVSPGTCSANVAFVHVEVRQKNRCTRR